MSLFSISFLDTECLDYMMYPLGHFNSLFIIRKAYSCIIQLSCDSIFLFGYSQSTKIGMYLIRKEKMSTKCWYNIMIQSSNCKEIKSIIMLVLNLNCSVVYECLLLT